MMNNLSKEDKMKMIQLGFTPFNPEHVKRYFAGQKPSLHEKQERTQGLYDDLSSDLGSGNYRDVMPTHSTYSESDDLRYSNNSANMTEKDYRASMMENMNDYANMDVNPVNELMSLKEVPRNHPQQNNAGIQEVASKGRQLALNYYNAFIQSLKSPGKQSDMAVFNALKEKLMFEKNLQSNKQLAEAYRSQSNKVTSEMYQKIKG
jgi:hypothetical protein